MLAAYVDLKKAFDSVHRESLWDLLRLRGIPARTIGLITGLYSGTESTVKCGAGVSSFFPVNTGVRQGCVLAPSLFNACMDWILDKVVDQSDCGASVGNTKITDLVFADDAVIFAESLEVLVMALEALHEEAKPLGLEVSWLKTKVQVFGDLLDEAVQSVHACGEDIEILESFTYLGSAVHNDGGSRQEALRRIGIAHGVMDSLSGSIWRCRYLCRRTKIWIFKSLVIPVLLYGCETWTLNSDLKRRINVFDATAHTTLGILDNIMRVLLILVSLAALVHANQHFIHTKPGFQGVQTLPGFTGGSQPFIGGGRPFISPPNLGGGIGSTRPFQRPQYGDGSRTSCYSQCPSTYGGRGICCRRWGRCCPQITRANKDLPCYTDRILSNAENVLRLYTNFHCFQTFLLSHE
ncbi:Hyastatin [Chionoecetes opilio]|uniref:Hyastatin n=1 Tax=Chionoecetes opilio TaxID=41210 RepID=A0A8J4Y2D7_CHIOP|nr:Hyastatin [Chionoecetes opilio]